MTKGKKHKFTKKQDRQAAHIAASEKAKGKSTKEAKRIGYATVNKQKSSKSKKKGKKFNAGAFEKARKNYFKMT